MIIPFFFIAVKTKNHFKNNTVSNLTRNSQEFFNSQNVFYPSVTFNHCLLLSSHCKLPTSLQIGLHHLRKSIQNWQNHRTCLRWHNLRQFLHQRKSQIGWILQCLFVETRFTNVQNWVGYITNYHWLGFNKSVARLG